MGGVRGDGVVELGRQPGVAQGLPVTAYGVVPGGVRDQLERVQPRHQGSRASRWKATRPSGQLSRLLSGPAPRSTEVAHRDLAALEDPADGTTAPPEGLLGAAADGVVEELARGGHPHHLEQHVADPDP